jgi:hypothetical protein
MRNYGKHRAGLEHDQQQVHLRRSWIETHDLLCHDYMRGTGDGQQFGCALYERNNNDLEQVRRCEIIVRFAARLGMDEPKSRVVGCLNCAHGRFGLLVAKERISCGRVAASSSTTQRCRVGTTSAADQDAVKGEPCDDSA